MQKLIMMLFLQKRLFGGSIILPLHLFPCANGTDWLIHFLAVYAGCLLHMN